MPSKRLSPEEERQLATATGAGDADACRTLVAAMLPSVLAVARQFPDGSGVSRQELLQEGVAGLLFATRRYDAALGTPFWAYASFWVRKAMQELVAALARPVVLSDRAARELALVRGARREHLQAHGAEPTLAELSAATGLSLLKLDSLHAAGRTPRGIEERVNGNGDGTLTVAETIRDPGAEAALDGVLDRIERGQLGGLIELLGERERSVVRAHYGLGQPARTLAEIGHSLGVTAERTRQIEAGALRTMREALARGAQVRVVPSTGGTGQPDPS